MWKWVIRAILIGFVGYVAYGAYDFYRAGLHTRPEIPEGAFSISYANGLRAIITGVGDEDEARRYFGFPQDVPHYLEDAWSICAPPDGDDVAMAEKFLEDRNMPGERFEVVCKIAADDDVVLRGVITSVPRL
jgi:hypothetical protein